jgi:hypothetical protein
MRVAVRRFRNDAIESFVPLALCVPQRGFRNQPTGSDAFSQPLVRAQRSAGEDYPELLGVVAEKQQNKTIRDFLKVRKGIERTAPLAAE